MGKAITLENVRLSYVHLNEPHAQNASDPNAERKYSCTVLVPKTDVAAKALIDQCIEQATIEGVASKWSGQRPPRVPNPVYDGDGVRPSDGSEFGPECKGHWVFTASSKEDKPPFLVDRRRNTIMQKQEVYSGMYANVSVSFFPYAFSGKKGVGCGLNGVQKMRDGEPLGGGISVAEAFKVYDAEPDANDPWGAPGNPPF